ncbi:putative bifunctional diguanylate cyclase/phosphodiesterase [Tepidiphilus olei]|uniref:putative bifunctional diguanylate cyclase/phosphodiesterase n=1 Tax=Tepidiphilus olei TaxID=2502184 RepID=UPI00163D791B|nr:EAL domain-containing protein [Tepidiphilus olei]
MTRPRFGLIARIAWLVLAIEALAFGALTAVYLDRSRTIMERRIEAQLQRVGRMLQEENLPLNAVATPCLMSDLIGLEYQGGFVLGGNGRVIVASDPFLLGKKAEEVPGFDPSWLNDAARPPIEASFTSERLTAVLRLRGPQTPIPLYTVVLDFDTAELRAAKREVIAWGTALSLAFLLFTSLAIVFVAHRLITRRVQRTLRALARIEEGALETRIPITYADELGDLQQGINSMTEKLAAYIAEQKRAQARIRQLAFYDQLTGLPNRIAALEHLREILLSCPQEYGALLLVDLDDFKTLNDTLGHEAGDELLRQIAERLRVEFESQGLIARAGGDEFLVILSRLGATEEQAKQRVEAVFSRLRESLALPCRIDHASVRTTASAGGALFHDGDPGLEELLKRADVAMYHAKASGRDRLCFFDEEMARAVRRRAELERDLVKAVETGQFVLYYQLQVRGPSWPVGAEALIRWPHPERGLISPAEFIPLAEETGLIVPLGWWILENACRQLVAWERKAETAGLTLSVNVSARQFYQPDFVERVLEILEKTEADPRRLKLELTESTLASDLGGIIDKMRVLKQRGIGFALDDFGTGYSSLGYLKRLPLDELKIDQSFVRDVLTDPNDAAIARTIVALAESLGLQVIAEGVETPEQWKFLAELGCPAYQGYYFARPLPIEQFEETLRQMLAPASSDGQGTVKFEAGGGT